MIIKGHFIFKDREKYIKKNLYSSNLTNSTSNHRIVMVYNGSIPHGGLADRLKSILCVYAVAKQYNLKFGIYHCHPFVLEDYLFPIYDWQIDPNVIIFDTKVARPSLISEISYTRFKNILKSTKMQLHIYATAYFPKVFKEFKYKKSDLFNELFSPSKQIKDEIMKYKSLYGKWIAVHFRFLNLLGDFEERELNKTLTVVERKALIEKCIKSILSLKNENISIFVCSDSMSFLKEVRKLDGVFIIDGAIIHTDHKNQVDKESYLKTFVDFFILGNSEKVYSVSTSQMYQSYFPVLASELNDIPFERIEI